MNILPGKGDATPIVPRRRESGFRRPCPSCGSTAFAWLSGSTLGGPTYCSVCSPLPLPRRPPRRTLRTSPLWLQALAGYGLLSAVAALVLLYELATG